MGAFQDGMRMGQGAYQQAIDNQMREREFALQQQAADRAEQEGQ